MRNTVKGWIEEDKKKAREEGIKEGIIQIIRNLVDGGFSIDDISKATKISKEKINKMLSKEGER